MFKALVIAEHHENKLAPGVLSTLNAALQITSEVEVLLACQEEKDLAQILAQCTGIKKVWVVRHARFAHPLAEDLTSLIVSLAKSYTHILAGATTFGKNLLPRVAAVLDVAQISDLCAVENAHTFIRPIYAGNAFEKIRSLDSQIVATVRITAFEAVKLGSQVASIEIISQDFTPFEKIEFKALNAPMLNRPELTSAKIVVSGGRGFKNAENFKMLEKLADRLQAAIGATRAAVDAGFVANDLQVGQTGKIVAPQLYIAIGISGAIQHLAGMKDSKIIVAINQDSEAPIFKIADYGLVGDLFTIIPELIAAL